MEGLYLVQLGNVFVSSNDEVFFSNEIPEFFESLTYSLDKAKKKAKEMGGKVVTIKFEEVK